MTHATFWKCAYLLSTTVTDDVQHTQQHCYLFTGIITVVTVAYIQLNIGVRNKKVATRSFAFLSGEAFPRLFGYRGGSLG